jgi:hypothetical protein
MVLYLTNVTHIVCYYSNTNLVSIHIDIKYAREFYASI